MSRRLLFLLSTFVPAGGTGCLRMVKWIKYLDQMGWQCDVVTGTTESPEYRDDSLVEDVPDSCNIYRMDYSGMFPAVTYRVVREVRKLASENSYRCLITTSPEDRNHVFGYVASVFSGMPWIADLRDPIEGKGQFLKRSVLKRANAVTTAWPVDDILKPEIAQYQETRWIPNGYDLDDFQSANSTREHSRVTFLHTGSLHAPYQNPLPVLEAVRVLRDRGDIRDTDCEFRFIGAIIGDELENTVRDFLSEHNLEELVTIKPFVDHMQSIREMKQADVGMIFKNRPSLSYKFCEYLGAGLPILIYSSGDSPMEEFSRGEDSIRFVPWGDQDPLIESINEYVDKDERVEPDQSIKERFSYETIRDQIYDVLESF
ncbi:MAG: glycosyltransferase [bacterium]